MAPTRTLQTPNPQNPKHNGSIEYAGKTPTWLFKIRHFGLRNLKTLWTDGGHIGHPIDFFGLVCESNLELEEYYREFYARVAKSNMKAAAEARIELIDG